MKVDLALGERIGHDPGDHHKIDRMHPDARKRLIKSVIINIGGGVDKKIISVADELHEDPFAVIEAIQHLRRSRYTRVDGTWSNVSVFVTTSDKVSLTKKGNRLYQSYAAGGDIHMGDIINAGNNSTVVNRSQVWDSYKFPAELLGPSQQSKALAILSNIITTRRDQKAAQLYNFLLQELHSAAPRLDLTHQTLTDLERILASPDAAHAIRSIRESLPKSGSY